MSDGGPGKSEDDSVEVCVKPVIIVLHVFSFALTESKNIREEQPMCPF